MPKSKVKWGEKQSVSANARQVLPKLAADYFQEVREFLAKDREPAELHKMRLAGKRLRYVLELFRPCYGPALDERVHALKKLQDALGDVNDAVAAGALLGNRVGKKVREYLSERAKEKASDFRKYWKEDFDSDGREKWWLDYLERSARQPGGRKRVVKRQKVS